MLIRLGLAQSAVALHIYRVGRSVPIRSRNPNKSRIKTQLLTRIGCFGLVWPGLTALDRSDQGAGLPGGIISSSGLQIGRSIYAFRLYRRDLRNGAVQLAFWQSYPYWFDRFIGPVWPVRPGWPANSVFATFGCQQKDDVSLGAKVWKMPLMASIHASIHGTAVSRFPVSYAGSEALQKKVQFHLCWYSFLNYFVLIHRNQPK